jgi:hypothetical protein
MIVSSTGCLQAVSNECEFVGNEREQSARLVGNESELTEAMFASKGDYICKLLQLPIGVFAWFVRVHHRSEYLTGQEARSTT